MRRQTCILIFKSYVYCQECVVATGSPALLAGVRGQGTASEGKQHVLIAVTLQTHIRDVPGSNIGRGNDYSQSFRVLYQALHASADIARLRGLHSL
jgi:hypothetical protein